MDKEDILCIIKECACSLAEKELIDKYGKLPEQLITQNGTYRIKYQDEFNKQYDKYESLLVRLSEKPPEAEQKACAGDNIRHIFFTALQENRGQGRTTPPTPPP